MTVAALFVDDSDQGIYPQLVGLPYCWGLTNDHDARQYPGTDPVVAHPPCNLWVNMAAVNYARATVCGGCHGVAGTPEAIARGLFCKRCDNTGHLTGAGRREPNRKVVLPAWYPGGSDGGCFASALASVRRCGGALEHPAGSHAWKAYGLHKPDRLGWNAPAYIVDDGDTDPAGWRHYWTAEVWQSAYGHAARKRTWLLYCGKHPPFELNWAREPGTHQIGWFDREKPTLSKKAASATPRAFAEELVRLAEWSKGLG